MVKKIIFIINPASGVFKKENIVEFIKSRLDISLFEPYFEFTQGPGHATELSKKWVKEDASIIVAVGGDGSVNEVARGMVGSDVVLGILPAGSGNGLAHHLNIPTNHKNALDVIHTGKSIKIDTGKINGHLFLSIAGIGFDGLVAKKFKQSKLRGFVSYLKIVAEEYPGYKPKRYTLELNDEVIDTRALFISFANSDQFGFNTSIAPDAKIDDGLLDIVIANKPQIFELPYLASLLYWRKIENSKYITARKTACLKIKSKKRRWVNVDGEAVKMAKEIIVKVNPLSLNVIVP
ncbi:MAG: diacylglycerol kinase family lipid kinase [Bacteroidales bacterium]|nr:diacylglycerol kinase family lipid kinase [Bacteroidales bacterium]MCF8404645.1 diacylglycerol kinase family lipid kinase [Bacteroidales bacterium]